MMESMASDASDAADESEPTGSVSPTTGFRLNDSVLPNESGGPTRWQGNDEIATKLEELADFLVIGGYEPSHASRYRRLARTVREWPESMEALRHEGRLRNFHDVGPTNRFMIEQLVDTRTCDKWADWAKRVPESVLELVQIPGVGVKTAVVLFQGYGIDSLAALERALEANRLGDIQGIGPKTVIRIRQHIEARARGEF